MEWLEMIMYSVPALLVLATTYLLLQQQARQNKAAADAAWRSKQTKQTLPIRLQAYERLVLFMERAEFNSLIPRVRDIDMTAQELQYALITAIRAEYEHNITQQIYVSAKLWRSIVLCKDELIKTINLVSASLPADATANELSRALFQFVINSEEPLPTQPVIGLLKQEATSLF